MAEARLVVRQVGPLVSFQDGGRPGHKRFGVPASGPMDRLAFATANIALGQPANATAIEISLAGLTLACEAGALSLALAGGAFELIRDGAKTTGPCVFSLRAGESVTIRPGGSGSWCYLSFAGTVSCAHWLGSSATHSISGLGGGMITAGQGIVVQDAELRPAREGPIPPLPAATRPDFRVVLGPQERHFPAATLEAFLNGEFRVGAAFDRMGMRLDGPKLALAQALSIPSEPVTRGAVQVAGDGVPTVLLADHQTTGGYPKIATVISADLDRLAQTRPGERIRFRAISPQEAISEFRRQSAQRAGYLKEIAPARGTLEERLMRENLISGVVG